ncbi:MAG: HAD family phosphatase [Deltaproteobacteria bacterium]|nr:HAD family phosphatase [Deltaproteobacteria bacterium]
MNPEQHTWGVIFDMDGVLIDSYRAHFLSWRKMLRNHGLDITEEQFAATFGRTNPDIFARLYPSVKKEHYPVLAEEKEAAFREIISTDFPEMKGASELIKALHEAGAALAIGSSGPRENLEAVLNALPGGTHFMATTNGSELTWGKPDPEVFLTAARKLGLPPERCVVVEDASVGVAAGKAAGCAVIAITGTATREHLKDADLVVDSLRELTPEIFKDLIFSLHQSKAFTTPLKP